MNIDLLLTARGEAGLVCDHGYDSPVAGVMYDGETRQLTLEHVNMDATDLNIPVEDEISERLYWLDSIQIGIIEDGQIQDNRQVPLVLLNDPAGDQGHRQMAKPGNSVVAFERFLKSAVSGQPIHRDDLANEDASASVMSGMNRAVLQFAPHLARQKSLEAQPNMNYAPSAPGMGMGGGGSGGGTRRAPTSQPNQNSQRQKGHDDPDEG